MAETFAPPRIESERRSDGRLLIRSVEPLADHPISVVHTFRAHSDAHPERLLVAERVGEEWGRLTWGEARAQVDRLAQGLIDRGLADRPVMVLSGNSRLHLVVALAAMTVGVPVVPTSVAYSLQSVDHAKLMRISMRVGLGESARFLRHHRSWMSRLLTRRFKPDPLLRALAPTLADPAANVAGFHLYTFNEVARTERWRRAALRRLGADPNSSMASSSHVAT